MNHWKVTAPTERRASRASRDSGQLGGSPWGEGPRGTVRAPFREWFPCHRRGWGVSLQGLMALPHLHHGWTQIRTVRGFPEREPRGPERPVGRDQCPRPRSGVYRLKRPPGRARWASKGHKRSPTLFDRVRPPGSERDVSTDSPWPSLLRAGVAATGGRRWSIPRR